MCATRQTLSASPLRLSLRHNLIASFGGLTPGWLEPRHRARLLVPDLPHDRRCT